MADELILVYETELPLSITVADGTGIEKGTILKSADPNTASAAAALGDVVAGVAAGEKIANDGRTQIAFYRKGRFKAKISGNVTNGDPLVISGPTANNLLQTAGVNAEQIFGTALETGTNGETILVELNPTVMQLA